MAETSAPPQQNCIFCQIISGKVQSKKVYEDGECIGILDINPANPGHILLLPKKHYAIMPQLNEIEMGHMFMVSKHLSAALLRALQAEGTNIFVANGAVAGQKAPHFMMHVIPRNEGDGLNLAVPEYRISAAELLKVREMLMPRIKANLGISDKDIEKMAADAPTVEDGQKTEEVSKEKPETSTQQHSETASAQSHNTQNILQSHENSAAQEQEKQKNNNSENKTIDLDIISSIINPKVQQMFSPASFASEDIKPENTTVSREDQEAENRNGEEGKKEDESSGKINERKKITLKDIDELFRKGKNGM